MTAKLSIASKEALISSLKYEKRPISILTGAPLSMPDTINSPGVPGVNGIIDIIQEHMKSANLATEFSRTIENLDSGRCYQKAFEFVRTWLNQDVVNEIIQKAVLKARIENNQNSPKEYEQDINGWYIPKGINYLAKIYAQDIITGPLLTTNFDPLLAVALKKEGRNPIQTILHCDGSLDQYQSIDSQQCNIVHLHGYWHGSDTLHTPDQLTTSRPKLKSSMLNLLREKVLLVIAYGGWDDIFLKALKDIVEDTTTNFDILWAFYEKEEEIISTKYKELVDLISPAIVRGRFRLYGGIECNDFFESLCKATTKNSLSTDDVDVAKDLENNIEEQIIPIDSFLEWKPSTCEAHKFVREVEQAQFIEEIKTSRIISLIADWGMGKADFINLSCKNSDSSLKLAKFFRVSLNNCESQRDIEDAISEQLCQPFQNFIVAASKSKENVIIIFDDFNPAYDKIEHEYIKGLKNIFSIIKDFSENIFTVLISRSSIKNLNYPEIKLNSLDDAEQKSYIFNHPNGGPKLIEKKYLTNLSKLSGGIPMQLDRLLSDLTAISIDELLEQERSISHIEDVNEPIPISLQQSVEMLSNTEDEQHLRSFMLLKILSVLRFGESLTGIKRFDNKRPIFPKHIKELKSLGLLETISPNSISNISIDDYKIHQVPPQVREYVVSLLPSQEINDIVRRATELTFGTRWKEKIYKLSSVAKHHVSNPSCSGVGNPHLLAVHLLRLSIENNIENEIEQAFNIGYYYCRQLLKFERYKDLAIASEEIIKIVKETSVDLPLFNLYSLYGRSLRMISEYNLSLQQLKTAINNFEPESKSDLASTNLTLALTYLALNDKINASLAAKKVQELTNQYDSSFLQASDILIDCEENEGEENYLKRKQDLEKVARENNANVVANNIILDIVRFRNKQKTKLDYYDSVINQNKDLYNKMRAAVNKGEILINEPDKIAKIRTDYLSLLNTSYSYFFTQRFDSLFNKCHKILWAIFEYKNDQESLCNLFKYSSIIWRLRENYSTEKEYAKKLNKINVPLLINDNFAKPSLIKYIQYRIKYIVNKK